MPWSSLVDDIFEEADSDHFLARDINPFSVALYSGCRTGRDIIFPGSVRVSEVVQVGVFQFQKETVVAGQGAHDHIFAFQVDDDDQFEHPIKKWIVYHGGFFGKQMKRKRENGLGDRSRFSNINLW